jgi:hypothetical protein
MERRDIRALLAEIGRPAQPPPAPAKTVLVWNAATQQAIDPLRRCPVAEPAE